MYRTDEVGDFGHSLMIRSAQGSLRSIRFVGSPVAEHGAVVCAGWGAIGPQVANGGGRGSRKGGWRDMCLVDSCFFTVID